MPGPPETGIFKLLRNPGIDSKESFRQPELPGGPVRQPYFSRSIPSPPIDCYKIPAPTTQSWKNPDFFKKTQPSGFFGVFWVFLGFFGFFLPRREGFRVFSVSRILLGASRL